MITREDDYPLVADDFENCIIGVACNTGNRAVVYSIQRMVRLIMDRDDVTYEEASEYLSYNTLGTWAGEGTPIYVFEVEDDDEAFDMITDMYGDPEEKGEEE